MGDNYIPVPSATAGYNVRTQDMIVSGVTVHAHYYIPINTSGVVVSYIGPASQILNNGQTLVSTTSITCTNFSAQTGYVNAITNMTVFNHGTSDTTVVIQDGSGGTAFWNSPAPGLGGSVQNFSKPIYQPTSSTSLYIALSSAATSVKVYLAGYKHPV